MNWHAESCEAVLKTNPFEVPSPAGAAHAPETVFADHEYEYGGSPPSASTDMGSDWPVSNTVNDEGDIDSERSGLITMFAVEFGDAVTKGAVALSRDNALNAYVHPAYDEPGMNA